MTERMTGAGGLCVCAFWKLRNDESVPPHTHCVAGHPAPPPPPNANQAPRGHTMVRPPAPASRLPRPPPVFFRGVVGPG
jgi:hypothetical protein